MGPAGCKACVTDELSSYARAYRVAHCQQRALMVGEVEVGGDQGEQRRKSKTAQDSPRVRREELRLPLPPSMHRCRPLLETSSGHKCSRSGGPREISVRPMLQDITNFLCITGAPQAADVTGRTRLSSGARRPG